jgi:hypothetical protein
VFTVDESQVGSLSGGGQTGSGEPASVAFVGSALTRQAPKGSPRPVTQTGEFFGETLSQHPQVILLDDREPSVGDRHRLGRAFGRRDQRAGRRGLELLRDRTRQDALGRAGDASRYRMTEPPDDTVSVGIAAWARLRDHEKATWADWLDVARALAVGRTAALKAADTNPCVGSRYNIAIGAWLKEHGLGDVVAQERYRLLLILRNIEAIETWRAGLDEAKRRRLNHPNAIWSHWRRAKTDADRPAPAVRNFVKAAMPSHRHGRAIFWPQDCARRAHEAMLKSRSSDLLVLARVALEAAIPTADVLADLRNETPKPEGLGPGPYGRRPRIDQRLWR